MKIYSGTRPRKGKARYIYLEHDSWDDYSYRSTYNVYYYNGYKEIHIGEAKIIDSEIDVGKVTVENSIGNLPHNMYSLV